MHKWIPAPVNLAIKASIGKDLDNPYASTKQGWDKITSITPKEAVIGAIEVGFPVIGKGLTSLVEYAGISSTSLGLGATSTYITTKVLLPITRYVGPRASQGLEWAGAKAYNLLKPIDIAPQTLGKAKWFADSALTYAKNYALVEGLRAPVYAGIDRLGLSSDYKTAYSLAGEAYQIVGLPGLGPVSAAGKAFLSKVTYREAKTFLPKLVTREGIKDIVLPFAKPFTKVTADQGIKTFSYQGAKAISGQILKPGLKVAGKEFLEGLHPANLVPTTIGITKDVTLFNTLTSGVGGAINSALGGDEKSFLIFYIPKFNSLSDAALKLSAQAYLTSTPFLSKEQGGTDLNGLLPFSINNTYLFSLGVSAFRPYFSPLLQNAPVLGRFEGWLADKELLIGGGKFSQGMLGSVNRFIQEEAVTEFAPGYIFNLAGIQGTTSEILQEMFDKKFDGNAVDMSKHIDAVLSADMDKYKQGSAGGIGSSLLKGVKDGLNSILPSVVAAAAPETPVNPVAKPSISLSPSTSLSLQGHEVPGAISTIQPATFNVPTGINVIPLGQNPVANAPPFVPSSPSIQGGGVTLDYLKRQIELAKTGILEAQEFLNAYKEEHLRAGSNLPERQMAALASSSNSKPALESTQSSIFARSTNTMKNAFSRITAQLGISSVNEKPKENIVYWPVNIAQSPIRESKAKNILLMDGNNLRGNLNSLLESQKHLIKDAGYFVTDKFSTDLVEISGRPIDEIRNTPGADIPAKGKSKNKFSDNRKLAIIFEEGGKVIAEIPNLFSSSYIAQKPKILGVWLINPKFIAKEKTLPIITTEYARDFGMTLRFNPKAHFSVDDQRSFTEKQKDLKPIVTETLDGEFTKSKELEKIAQAHNEKFTLKIDLHDYNPALYDPDWKNGFYDSSLLINSLKKYFSYILVEKLDDREVVYASNSGLDTLPKPVFINKVYSVTPDSLGRGIKGVSQSATPDIANIPPAKLDSAVKKEPEYLHMGLPITPEKFDRAVGKLFKSVGGMMTRISDPLNSLNPFSPLREARKFVNNNPQFKTNEQGLREIVRGYDRWDALSLLSTAQNYTGIIKITDDFKSLFTIIETNRKDSSLSSFSNDIFTFSSIPAIKEKISLVQDLEPLAEVLRDINDISLIKGLPFDSIKSRITTTKDLRLLPELQKISGNIKGVFEIASLPEVKNLTPKFEDLKPIADLVRDNPVDRIRNANRFIFYVLKQSPKTIAEWKGLADRFSISSERSQYFEKVFNDLRIEFPEKDISNAFLKYSGGFFITLDRLKSEYGGVLPSIKKLGLETVSAGLDHSAYRDKDGYGNTIVSSSEIDKALMRLGDQWSYEDSRLFTTFEKLRNEIGADNLLKAFKERGLLRVEQAIYGMKKTPILMDVAKEIGILNFLKLEGLAFTAVEKDPQSFAKGFKIVEKEFNKDIIEKVAMGDNFSDINVYSQSNFVLVSQFLGKAPSLIAAVKEIGLPRLIDVMNYGKSSDNDYLEQKPLEFVEGFNIIQKEFNDEIDKVLSNEDESTKYWVCNGLVRLSQMAKDEPKVSDFIKLFGLKDLSLAVSFSKNLSYKGFDSISTLSKFGNEIVDLSNESASFKAYAPHMVYSLYVLPGLLNKFSNTAADTKLTLQTVSEIAQAFGNPKVVEAITYYADNNDSKIKSVNDLVSMKSEIVDLSKESAAFKTYAPSMVEHLPGILNKFSKTAADTKLTLQTVSEIAQAFGSPKVFEVIDADTNKNDSKIKSVNDLVSLKLKISDIGKNFQNLEAKVTEAKVDNFDTRGILKLVIIDNELEYAKRATDFIIQENNQIMLQTKSILLGNLLRQAYHPEVFTSITKFAKEKVDRADSLAFFRAMNNFISQSVMEKQDTLQDWQLLLNDYTNRFGYLANKDMVLAHRYLSRNEPLEGAKLAGYALQDMGITSTGEKGIGEFELAIKSLSKKLLEQGEIKEEDINNPIAKGIIGGLTGYSSATWGHGRHTDLSVFVSEFDRAKEQGLISPLEAVYNEKHSFSVRKIGKVEFSKDVNDALLKYQNWVKQGIDLSTMPLPEQLKQLKAEIAEGLDKQLEKIRTGSGDPSYIQTEISKIVALKNSLPETSDLLGLLRNIVMKMGNGINVIDGPVAIALIVHTLNSYPNQRLELSKVLEQGPLFNFVPKLIALKDEFIKENILKDVDKGIQKPLLNLFKFNQIEKEIKDVIYLQETAKVEAFATKGILGEMAGDIGDACYTQQHLITGIKHLTPVIFTTGKGLDKKLVGSMLILENSQENKPVLITRAINPRDEFISEYSSEDFVKGAIEYAEKVAKVKEASVSAPVKVPGSLTNRHGFIDIAIGKFVTGDAVKLNKIENFNGYDITNGCVAVKSGTNWDVPQSTAPDTANPSKLDSPAKPAEAPKLEGSSEIDFILREIDSYIEARNTINVQKVEEHLAKLKQKGASDEDIKLQEEMINEAKKNLEDYNKAKELKNALKNISDFGLAMQILKKYSRETDPNEREMIDSLSQAIPTFNKESALFIDNSHLLGGIFKFNSDEALGKLVGNRLVLVDAEIAVKYPKEVALYLLKVISHEEYHKQDRIPREGGIAN